MKCKERDITLMLKSFDELQIKINNRVMLYRNELQLIVRSHEFKEVKDVKFFTELGSDALLHILQKAYAEESSMNELMRDVEDILNESDE